MSIVLVTRKIEYMKITSGRELFCRLFHIVRKYFYIEKGMFETSLFNSLKLAWFEILSNYVLPTFKVIKTIQANSVAVQLNINIVTENSVSV